MASQGIQKYAVIRLQGQQFKVKEGEEILVGRISDPQKVEAEVLLVVDGDKVKVGKPHAREAKVSLKVLGEEKGGKVDVYKFKAKSRYKRHTGFRPLYSKVLIEKIG